MIKFSRAKLEELVGEDIKRSIELMLGVIKDAKFTVADIDEVVLVGGQTRMPAIQDAVKKVFGFEPHKGVNPDEVVAVGAAIQAGIMQGDVKDILLLDVTPLSLGIETLGGVFTRLIEKNTTIPTAKSQVFSTAADNQTSVEIHVLQGEREMAGDNKTLARFILDGIPSSPRGIPQVEVTFDIDANGILNVSAKDKASGKVQTVRIEASTGLSKDEIEKAKNEAKMHEAEDKKKRELIETKNMAESSVYAAEKALKDLPAEASAKEGAGEIIKSVQEKIEAVKAVKDGDDVEAIKKALAELGQELQKIGQYVYKPEAPKGAAGPEQSEGEEKK